MLLPELKEINQMDHSSHAVLADSELNEETLIDAVVYGADDEKIGTVSHVHGMG